jgi:cytochrome bd-type quinol oxidase subunit 2
MNTESLLAALDLLNETLVATIIIVSASILLYNLSRGTQDRVTRTSSVMLVCVILAFLSDVFISLDPDGEYLEIWLRFQWLGIAFVPAALVHLSDALLATTGRPSRRRRKAVVRVSYLLSTIFTVLALATDAVVSGPTSHDLPHMKAGPLFPVYVAYLLVIALLPLSTWFALAALPDPLYTPPHDLPVGGVPDPGLWDLSIFAAGRSG